MESLTIEKFIKEDGEAKTQMHKCTGGWFTWDSVVDKQCENSLAEPQ